MADNRELIDALEAAGCIDTDVWVLAKKDVATAVAVADMKIRYPAAFEVVFDARTATKAECDAWLRKHNEGVRREENRRRDAADLARMQAKHGAKV